MKNTGDKYCPELNAMPLGLRIGVTGHRKNINEELVSKQVKEVLNKLDNSLHKKLKKTPYYFTVISPLAEGADRLVAKEVLNWKSGDIANKLDVILPLQEKEYIKDFHTDKSKKEFHELLENSHIKKTFRNCKSRDEAYENVGRYVVNNCDVLIAIWNQRPAMGKGGTGEIIDYAKSVDKPIFLINSVTGKLSEPKKKSSWHKIGDIIKFLDIYNKETLKESKIKKNQAQHYNFLEKKLNDSKISYTLLDPLFNNLILNFVRADLLAAKYQSLYMKADRIVYILAASAVITVPVQEQFFSQIPYISWLQVILIFTVVALLSISRVKDFHRRWIDYRFLSENLRSSIFFSIMDMKPKITDPMPYSKPAHYCDWVNRTCDWICDRQLQSKPDTEVPLEKLKDFLLNAWISDQITFYKKKSIENMKKNELISQSGFILFGISLVVVIINATRATVMNTPNFTISNLLGIIVITTTFAGVVIGISKHYEYLRNSKRYENMIPYLSAVKDEIKKSEDKDTLINLLDKANKVMLAEHQDWQAIFSFHELERP